MSLLYKAILALFFIVTFGWLTQPVFAGNPPDASKSTLVSSEVRADGTSQATITITLHDASDVQLNGDTVSLSSPGNPTIIFSPASTTLNAIGIATFSATATNPGTFQVTVTDTTTSTTLSDLGTITFDIDPGVPPPGTTNPSCSDSTPTAAPDLYQITPDKTFVTLYFSPPNTQYDGFIISYGLTPTADNYSVRIGQSQTNGAIKYVVNALTEKTYYFKVAATKGCAVGPWSQIVSSQNLSNIKTLPETGPNTLLLVGGIGAMIMIFGGFMLMLFL